MSRDASVRLKLSFSSYFSGDNDSCSNERLGERSHSILLSYRFKEPNIDDTLECVVPRFARPLTIICGVFIYSLCNSACGYPVINAFFFFFYSGLIEKYAGSNLGFQLSLTAAMANKSRAKNKAFALEREREGEEKQRAKGGGERERERENTAYIECKHSIREL